MQILTQCKLETCAGLGCAGEVWHFQVHARMNDFKKCTDAALRPLGTANIAEDIINEYSDSFLFNAILTF